MISRRVIKRYASALFAAASKSDAVDRIESDLGLVMLTVGSSAGLRDALVSPVIPPETKKAIVDELFGGRLHEITLSYLNLLIEKNREEAFVETEQEYVLIANEARGIVEAEATTAVPLDEVQQAQLTSKLNAVTGKQIKLVCHVDPAALGGVLVRIGDKLIDGSIRGQLDQLREELLS